VKRFLKDNPDLFATLNERVREALGLVERDEEEKEKASEKK
jgi:hypothetical protein